MLTTFTRISLLSSLASLAFLTVFQVLLCLATPCFGVSIVWCALLGISFTTSIKSTGYHRKVASIVSILVYQLCIVAIIYYYQTEEFITTIAHILAIIMGMLMVKITRMVYQKNQLEEYVQVDQ